MEDVANTGRWRGGWYERYPIEKYSLKSLNLQQLLWQRSGFNHHKFQKKPDLILASLLGNIIQQETDRHHYFKSGNIPKTEGGQIHLTLVTVL